MNVLILGSGGREHALSWKIKQSELLDKLYVAPGNAGTAKIAENVNLSLNNFKSIRNFIKKHQISLVLIGPEVPLVEGIVDFLKVDSEPNELKIIGPDKNAAQLEGSKEFAKAFMHKYNIPTARYKSFTKDQLTDAFSFLDELKAPFVLKADGLAAGKGVIIEQNLNIAKEKLSTLLNGQFGEASRKVVIEEFLLGIELSVFVLTDGNDYLILPEAKDYKKIGENDIGLNTGGMGAVSPVSFADKKFMDRVEDKIIRPTITGIKQEGFNYKGFVFFGLMNVQGEPFVIEYNVRMGDPETEVVIPRIKNDLLEILNNLFESNFSEIRLDITKKSVCTVMLVSKGYPGSYEKNKEIHIQQEMKDTLLFHAGTKLDGNEVVSSGGRVIAVSAFGKNMEDALSKSYQMIENINFEGKSYRKDIGFDLK